MEGARFDRKLYKKNSLTTLTTTTIKLESKRGVEENYFSVCVTIFFAQLQLIINNGGGGTLIFDVIFPLQKSAPVL